MGQPLRFYCWGVVLLDYDIHIVLLCALAVVCIASVPLGYSFMDLVDCMKKSLGQALAAMIIFIFIGIIISLTVNRVFQSVYNFN